jgi:hypothetical protein
MGNSLEHGESPEVLVQRYQNSPFSGFACLPLRDAGEAAWLAERGRDGVRRR